MIRTRLGASHIKRTLRQLYGFTQATPKSVFLDPDFDRQAHNGVYPGYAMVKGAGELVTVSGLEDDLPYGLAALYVGGDGIDEPLDVGVNAFAVWALGSEAEFEVLAPAFDQDLTWTDGELVYASMVDGEQGRLVNDSVGAAGTDRTTAPVARVLKVASPTKLVVGGLQSRSL